MSNIQVSQSNLFNKRADRISNSSLDLLSVTSNAFFLQTPYEMVTTSKVVKQGSRLLLAVRAVSERLYVYIE